jgi:predicted transcriptional regulator
MNSDEFQSEEQCDEKEIAAILEGLKDVAEGRVVPLEEFDRNFRGKYNIGRRPSSS